MEDLRVTKTKKALKNSFVYLLGIKPLSKFNVTDICQKANINRVTFYSHYKSKEDLLENIIDENLTTIVNHVNYDLAISSKENKTATILKSLTKSVILFIQNSHCIKYALNNDEHDTILNLIMAKSSDIILKFLEEIFKNDSPTIQISTLKDIILGGFAEIILTEIIHKEEYNPELITKDIYFVIDKLIEVNILPRN